jgi:hypothetical protein
MKNSKLTGRSATDDVPTGLADLGFNEVSKKRQK